MKKSKLNLIEIIYDIFISQNEMHVLLIVAITRIKCHQMIFMNSGKQAEISCLCFQECINR